MRRLKSCAVLFLALLILPAGATFCSAEESSETLVARDIIMEARDKQFPKNSIINLTMVLINKRGNKRVRKIETKRKTQEDGEAKSVAYFRAPADVKGTAFLVWEHKDQDNDVFIYLPALKKIRRIASDQKNQSFMGSDFSYADMENEDIDSAVHKTVREEEWQGKACWVIESIPKPDSDSEYSKMITWVSKENQIPEKVDYYDKKGKHFKIMEVVRVGPVGEAILPLHFTMENVKKNHKTEIILEEVKLDQDIPDKEFTKRTIQRR